MVASSAQFLRAIDDTGSKSLLIAMYDWIADAPRSVPSDVANAAALRTVLGLHVKRRTIRQLSGVVSLERAVAVAVELVG